MLFNDTIASLEYYRKDLDQTQSPEREETGNTESEPWGM